MCGSVKFTRPGSLPLRTILHPHLKKPSMKSLPALHNVLKFLAFWYIWLPLVLRPTCSSLVQVNTEWVLRFQLKSRVDHRGHFLYARQWTIITTFETTNNFSLSAFRPACVCVCVSDDAHYLKRSSYGFHVESVLGMLLLLNNEVLSLTVLLREECVQAHPRRAGEKQVLLRLARFNVRFALRFKTVICALPLPAVKPQGDQLVLFPVSPLRQKSILPLPSQRWPKLNWKSILM